MEEITPDPRETWSEWLRTQIDANNWRQADLVKHSKEISRDRVSKWLSGKEKPTHSFAIIAANALNADVNEALKAAGFMTPDEAAAHFAPVTPVVDIHIRNATRDFSDTELLSELLRRSRNRELPNVSAYENNAKAAADNSVDEQHLEDRQP